MMEFFLVIALPLRLALRFIPGGNTLHLLVVLVVAGLGYVTSTSLISVTSHTCVDGIKTPAELAIIVTFPLDWYKAQYLQAEIPQKLYWGQEFEQGSSLF